MTVKRAQQRVSGEVEAFLLKPDDKDLSVKPYQKGLVGINVGDKRYWLVPEPAGMTQQGLNIAECLTHVVGDANELDRDLAGAYAALRQFVKNRYGGAGLTVAPMRFGTESEAEGSPRTVLGGHIQYTSPEWREGGGLDVDKIVADSQKIRKFAIPFINVDAGVERACRRDGPCGPSDRLYLRKRASGRIPPEDKKYLEGLPVGDDMELMLSGEPLSGPTGLVNVLNLEVRNPPVGMAMGKHALDVLVAVQQDLHAGGFNVPLSQEECIWGGLEERFPSLRQDMPYMEHAFSRHGINGMEPLNVIRQSLEAIKGELTRTHARKLEKAFMSALEHEARYNEYEGAFDRAARMRYRAPVSFGGESMLMRDAYALHYLRNRAVYDGADPAILEWVRAATDNGFSYTDFRLALRGFFQDRDGFNSVVDEITRGSFTPQADGRRPTTGSVLINLATETKLKEEGDFLKSLALFLSHRHSRSPADGAVPEGVGDVVLSGELVRARVPATEANLETLGLMLDAGFIPAESGRRPDGVGYFALEYNRAPQLQRKSAITEGL